jgi:hypothetical protein
LLLREVTDWLDCVLFASWQATCFTCETLLAVTGAGIQVRLDYIIMEAATALTRKKKIGQGPGFLSRLRILIAGA